MVHHRDITRRTEGVESIRVPSESNKIPDTSSSITPRGEGDDGEKYGGVEEGEEGEER